MADFKVGDKVLELNSNRKGRVVEVLPYRRGKQLYKVLFLGEDAEELMLETNLKGDFDVSDPFECCKQNIYGNYTEFSKINTTFKIQNSNNSTISSLKASKTLFKAYQFKPLLKYLNSDNRRLLISDEVGLGKTIEAGHILLELKARGEFKNALIVCPKSLMPKWQTELKDKFGLDFIIYEDRKALDQDFKMRNGSVRAIVSYERIRLPKRGEKVANSFIGFIEENKINFSMVLCDEAHRMRNKNQTSDGAEILMQHTRSAVFLTATPIMISTENLYNLLHLLDAQRYNDKTDFENSLELNKPFIQALGQLKTKMPLPEIAEELIQANVNTVYIINDNVTTYTHTIGDKFKDLPIFQRIIKRMKTEEDSFKLRAELQYDLNSMSEMNNIFSRTRKREVTTDWTQAERDPHLIPVSLHKEERHFFENVLNEYIDENSYTDEYGDLKMSQGTVLGLIQKKRQVSSSVYAYLNDVDFLNRGIDEFDDCKDAKVEELIRIIDEVFVHGKRKIIVFAIFVKTLKYLHIRLKKHGFKCAIIHNGVEDREKELHRFKFDPETSVLLSSEVGSEGLDMQFCSSMVNYDLPWNPMVVEQRIGRIDRFGQTDPKVHIYNLVVKDSIQEEIYVRLLDRIGIFRSSIGDIEAILNAEMEKSASRGNKISIQKMYDSLENELYCENLTPEERARKMDEIALAIESEKEQLKKIDEGLTNALTNDSYFRQQIDKILKNSSYVTEKELYNYVDMLMSTALPSCSLEPMGDETYILKIPKSDPRKLIIFLSNHQPRSADYDIIYRQFKNRIEDKTELRITFNQEVAFNDSELIFINLYNPIVQSALLYFMEQGDEKKRTFCFEMKKSKMEDLHSNKYFLVVYQVTTSRLVYGIKRSSSVLYPILYDVDNQGVVDDDEMASRFMGVSQTEGLYQFANQNSNPSLDVIEDMKFDVVEYISDVVKKQKEDKALRLENDRQKQLMLLEERTKTRLESLQASLKENEHNLELLKNAMQFETVREMEDIQKKYREIEGAVRLIQANINRIEREKEDQLAVINTDPQLDVRYNFISLNLVTLI